jgi:hypothetical protein
MTLILAPSSTPAKKPVRQSAPTAEKAVATAEPEA